MNKKITAALVAAITTFGVYAQAPAPCQGHEKHECAKKHENMTPQQRAEMRTAKMTKDLNLTEEQQKKISKMNLANAKKHEAKKKKMEKAHAKAKEKMMKEGTTMVPRLIKTNPGDIFTTNCIGEASVTLGDLLTPRAKDGILSKEGAADAAMQWQVVKIYTMPDHQPGVKLVRVK